jgi:hypothetical protein
MLAVSVNGENKILSPEEVSAMVGTKQAYYISYVGVLTVGI